MNMKNNPPHLPFTPPPPTVTYRVRINLEEWTDYKTPINSSKFVADNIYAGNSAQVEFKDAGDLEGVRTKFENRITEWLRQLGHSSGYYHELIESIAHYRLRK